jgi:hypothetical protein
MSLQKQGIYKQLDVIFNQGDALAIQVLSQKTSIEIFELLTETDSAFLDVILRAKTPENLYQLIDESIDNKYQKDCLFEKLDDVVGRLDWYLEDEETFTNNRYFNISDQEYEYNKYYTNLQEGLEIISKAHNLYLQNN